MVRVALHQMVLRYVRDPAVGLLTAEQIAVVCVVDLVKIAGARIFDGQTRGNDKVHAVFRQRIYSSDRADHIALRARMVGRVRPVGSPCDFCILRYGRTTSQPLHCALNTLCNCGGIGIHRRFLPVLHNDQIPGPVAVVQKLVILALFRADIAAAVLVRGIPLILRTGPRRSCDMRTARRIISEQFSAAHRGKHRDIDLIFQTGIFQHQTSPLGHVNRVTVANHKHL